MFKEVSEEVKEKRNKVIKKSCNNIEAGLNMLRAIDKLYAYIPPENSHTIDKLKADWAVQTLENLQFCTLYAEEIHKYNKRKEEHLLSEIKEANDGNN